MLDKRTPKVSRIAGRLDNKRDGNPVAGCDLQIRPESSPWRISLGGWKAIFLKTYSEMNDDRLPAVAGGGTFFVVLAILPTIGASVSLYGLFPDPTRIGTISRRSPGNAGGCFQASER